MPDETERKKDPVIVKDSDRPEQTDPVEESRATGTAHTDDGREVRLNPGAVPEGAKDVSDDGRDPNRALDADELKELKGELTAGEIGHLPLDAEGYITGAAKRGEPEPGSFFAEVQLNSNWPQSGAYMTTPAGADITRRMTPSTRVSDEHNKNFEKAAEELSTDTRAESEAEADEDDGS